MQNIVDLIIKIRSVIMAKKYSVDHPDLNTILLHTFLYDNIFDTFLTKNYIEERKKYIINSKLVQAIEKQQNKIKELVNQTFDQLKKEKLFPIAQKKGISDFLLVKTTIDNVNSIFPSLDLKINYEGMEENLYSALQLIAKLFFKLINKRSLKLSWTYGTIITNLIFRKINLPSIYFHSEDRARILRSADHYVDFEKEFILTISDFLNKNLSLNNFLESETLENLRQTQKKDSIYTRLGYKWRNNNDLMTTWLDYNKFDDLINNI